MTDCKKFQRFRSDHHQTTLQFGTLAASGRMPVALWDALAASGRMPVALWMFHEKRVKPEAWAPATHMSASRNLASILQCVFCAVALFITDPVVRNDSTHRSIVLRSGIAPSRATLNCRRKRRTVATESLFLKNCSTAKTLCSTFHGCMATELIPLQHRSYRGGQ